VTTTTQRHLIDSGRLIEAGWLDVRATMPPDANVEWVDNMRTSFFAGARYLFKNIVTAARSDGGMTHVNMQKIDQELEYFLTENVLKNAPVAGHA